MPAKKKITALVLAGSRNGTDAVARAAGVSCKALAPLAGVPMVVRVLQALLASARVDAIVLSGPGRDAVASCPPLQDFIRREQITWVPAARRLSDSVQAGLAGIAADTLVLITTADHALLDAGILNHFLGRASAGGADVYAGLVGHGLIEARYPSVRRTVLRFAEGGYCGCNLYALRGARARDIVSSWQRIQARRKRPWRMVFGLFGCGALLRYICGRLSMAQTRQAILEATGVALDFISLPFPHAGIDVDTLEDKKLVEEILGVGD